MVTTGYLYINTHHLIFDELHSLVVFDRCLAQICIGLMSLLCKTNKIVIFNLAVWFVSV